MRRRALLLVLLATGLALGAGSALGRTASPWHDAPGRGTSLARAPVADVPSPTTVTRPRASVSGDLGARPDLAAVLGVALALILAGAWCLAAGRARRVTAVRPIPTCGSRAPPWLPAIVRC
jgi:hypothetical protein